MSNNQEPPFEADEVYDDLMALLDDDDEEEVALRSMRAAEASAEPTGTSLPALPPRPTGGLTAADNDDFEGLLYGDEDEEESSYDDEEDDDDEPEDEELSDEPQLVDDESDEAWGDFDFDGFDDDDDETEEDAEDSEDDWDWGEIESSVSSENADKGWVDDGWDEGFSDMSGLSQNAESEGVSEPENDNSDLFDDDDTPDSEDDELDDFAYDEPDVDSKQSDLKSKVSGKWKQFKKQAAAELHGKDASDDDDDDDENDDSDDQSSSGRQFPAPFYRPMLLLLTIIGKIPLIGRPFANLAENEPLVRKLSHAFPLVLVLVLAVFLNGRAVPSETQYTFPDGGSVRSSDHKMSGDGTGTVTLANDGEVIARVDTNAEVYATNAVNPITWFKPKVIGKCKIGEGSVELGIGDTKSLPISCTLDDSGFWKRLKPVLKQTEVREG